MARGPSKTAYSKLLVDRFGVALSLTDLPAAASKERVPVGLAHHLLQRAVAQTSDALLGLKAGRMSTYGDAGPLDYAMQSAATVEQALATASRFIRVLNGELDIVSHTRDGRVHVELRSRAPLPKPIEDFLVSALYTVHMRRLLPDAADLVCSFSQPQPNDVSAYERTFAPSRLLFAAGQPGFSFDAGWSSRPLPSADPKLHAILTHYLERDLRELPDAHSFSEQVQKLMQQQTPMRAAAAKVMAGMLKTSARTLARRLHDEGTSFGEVLDDVRRTRALRYLADDSMTAEDIATVLGFSGSPAFHRAFKRWTGLTPRAYRMSQRGSSGSREQ